MVVPRVRQDDFLARPGRRRGLGLLHRHQVADVGQHRFQIRHLVLRRRIGRDSAESDRRGSAQKLDRTLRGRIGFGNAETAIETQREDS